MNIIRKIYRRGLNICRLDSTTSQMVGQYRENKVVGRMINSKPENTIERLFELAIELEYKTADIYERFSTLFQHIPELPAFWQGLHDDEIQHVITLQNVRKSLTFEQLLVCPPTEFRESVMKIQRIISKDVFESINNLNDAYELANELEFFKTNTIFNFLTSKIIPSGKSVEIDYSGIVKHQQKLMDFCHSFGNREKRSRFKIFHSVNNSQKKIYKMKIGIDNCYPT